MTTSTDGRASFFRQWGLELLFFALIAASGVAFNRLEPHTALMNDALHYAATAWALHGVDLGYTPEFIHSNFFRAQWYVLMLAAMQLLGDWLPRLDWLNATRLAQVLLLALNGVLMIRIVRRLHNEALAPVLCGLLALFYWPMLFQTDRLLTETQTATFVLLAVRFWLDHKPRWAGVWLYVAFSNSLLTLWPKTIVLAALIACSALVCKGDRRRLAEGGAVFLGLSLLTTGVMLLFPRMPFKPVYYWQYFDTQGWAPLNDFNGMLTLLFAQPFKLPGFLEQQLPPAVLEPLKTFIQHPDLFLQRYLVNVYRFFALPDNPYQQSWWGITPEGLNVLHGLAVALAAIGLIRLFEADAAIRRRWPLYCLALMWGLTYAGTNIELRYNLPVMPLVLILSALTLADLWQCATRQPLRHQTLNTLTGLAGGVALVWYARPLLLSGFNVPADSAWYGLLFCLLVGLAGALVFVSARRLLGSPALCPGWRAGSVGVILCGLLVLVQGSHWALDPQYLPAVETPLSSRDARPASQRVAITPAFSAPAADGQPMDTYLLVETAPVIDPPGSRLEIRLDGQTVNTAPYTARQVPGGLRLQEHLLGGLRRPEDIRQYRFYPLPERLLPPAKRDIQWATVTLALKTDNPDTPVQLTLLGDPPAGERRVEGRPAARYILPNPDWSCFSIYKYLYDAEGRLPTPVTHLLPPEQARPAVHHRVFLLRFPHLSPASANSKTPQPDEYPMPRFSLSPEGAIVKDLRIAY